LSSTQSLHLNYLIVHVNHFFFFFFTDPSTTDIYTLSLHDALPISQTRCPCPPDRSASGSRACARPADRAEPGRAGACRLAGRPRDRKSTRLNSSHVAISYAVFCLKKKKTK